MSVRKAEQSIDYTAIVQSDEFKDLMSRKKSFIVPISIFFFIFYFTLPLMTAYSKVLNNYAIGSISWAWLFAFAQFIMTWTLIMVYTKKAGGFDVIVEKILGKVYGRR